MRTDFWWGNLKKRHRYEDLDVSVENNIKMDLREIGWGGMGWIDLIQDRDQRRAFVKTVMNLRVSQNNGKFLSS
jgi:hypothetical protein